MIVDHVVLFVEVETSDSSSPSSPVITSTHTMMTMEMVRGVRMVVVVMIEALGGSRHGIEPRLPHHGGMTRMGHAMEIKRRHLPASRR